MAISLDPSRRHLKMPVPSDNAAVELPTHCPRAQWCSAVNPHTAVLATLSHRDQSPQTTHLYRALSVECPISAAPSSSRKACPDLDRRTSRLSSYVREKARCDRAGHPAQIE